MTFFELYSVRNNPKITDVYEYEVISEKCRTQISFILMDIIKLMGTNTKVTLNQLDLDLRKELGILQFIIEGDDYGNVLVYMLSCDNITYLDCLDYIMNYFFNHIVHSEKSRYFVYPSVAKEFDTQIELLNHRFQQNSIGYEVIEGQLVRIDNKFVHAEVIKNAIHLLSENEFSAVSEEFLKAHEHYRQGNYKDAIVNAGKAFESTMKTICSKRGYQYDAQRDTANTLIKRLFDNEFIPPYMQSHFQGLKQALENSTHVLRNKNGGHGQGDEILDVDDSIVRYTLNLCATNIVFLVERYKEHR